MKGKKMEFKSEVEKKERLKSSPQRIIDLIFDYYGADPKYFIPSQDGSAELASEIVDICTEIKDYPIKSAKLILNTVKTGKGFYREFKCEACKQIMPKREHFCPNCGAKFI